MVFVRPDLRSLLRYPVDFELADAPEESRFVFRTPRGDERATANEAVGPLSQGIRALSADDTVRAWATPALVALRIMARGALESPDASELNELREAARYIDVDASRGQAKIAGFLKALAADAPDVARTPQRGRSPEPRPDEPRTFRYTLTISFLTEPTDEQVAVVRLKAQPRTGRTAAIDAAELFGPTSTTFNEDAREAATAMLGRLAERWEPASRLGDPHARGAVTVGTDDVAALGSSALAPALMANHVEVQWPADLVRELGTSALVQRAEGPRSDRPAAFASGQLFRFDWQVALGSDVLSAQEVDQLAKSQHGLLRLRNRWVFVDKNDLRDVLARRSQELSPFDALRAAVTGEIDVDGRTVEVSTGVELRESRRINEREPVPVKLSHVVVNTPDLPRTTQWYIDHLDFAISDTLYSPKMGDLMNFMRCNNAHHSFAVAQGPHFSLHHASFEMRGVEEWMRGAGKILRSGARMVWGPGRHNAGDNTFAYFLDPAGNTLEYTTELATIDDEDTWHPSRLDVNDVTTQDQWGTANEMNELVARESFNDPDLGLFVAPPV